MSASVSHEAKRARGGIVVVLCAVVLPLQRVSAPMAEATPVANSWLPESPTPKKVHKALKITLSRNVNRTKPFRYPYMASIAKNNVHHCTGVFIRPNVVLTAAHCVDPRRITAAQLSVRFFRTKRGGQKQENVKVSKIKMHPNYRGQGGGFNLALVKIASIDSQAKVIQFENKWKVVAKPGETLLSLGWGRTSQSSGSSPQLQRAGLPVLDEKTCFQKLGGEIIYPLEFCAGSRGQGPCPGDDGGPLLRRGRRAKSDVLVGIATSQLACGSFGKPDVFTRISEYRPWMISEADKL